MSVDRAIQLLQQLAANLEFLAAVENASPDQKGAVLSQYGFSPADVSSDDVTAAVRQSRLGTGLFQDPSRPLPAPVHEIRVYLAAAVSTDGYKGDW